MKEYKVYDEKWNMMVLCGDTLKEAIENDFEKIIKDNAGNEVGYVLEEVWMEFDDEVDPVGVAKLHIIISGNDELINFDPIENPPKELIYTIKGVKKEELPEREYFELSENESFNPFDKKWLDNKSAAYGIFLGTIDHIGEFCSTLKNNDKFIISGIKNAYPGLEKSNFPAFVSQVLIKLNQIKPKNDIKTQELLDLVYATHETFADTKELTPSEQGLKSLYYHKTCSALRKRNRITALQYYRNISGKTQQQVANEVGVSLRQYQRYERIDSTLGNTKEYVIEKIANVLNVSTDKIFDGNFVIYKYQN